MISGQNKYHSIKVLDFNLDSSETAPGYSIEENKYDVGFYFIDLEVSNRNTYIRGNTLINLRKLVPKMDTLVCELSRALSIDSVFIQDQRNNSYIHENNLVKILISNTYQDKDNISLRIYYHGIAGSGGYYSGISSKTDSKSNQEITYTLSEPFQAKDWFPVKQNLRDKADSAWIFVTVDSTLKAGSNGLLVNIESLPDGRKKYEWKSRYPVSYYLISISVGDYIDYSFYAPAGENDSVLIQNFIYSAPGIMDEVKDIIDQTSPIIELFSEKFGTYPFINEKYGHCMAPLGGGMEHQTMTTISGFDFSIIAHELGHQWFGDYVTCGTWQDIWINEGFATYAEYIATEFLTGSREAVEWLDKTHNSAINYPEGVVYLSPEEWTSVSRIFHYGLSYEKGGSILHMLRYEIDSDSVFFTILKDYLSRFANGNATGDDFRQVAEYHAKEDLNWFFDQWYYGRGYPQFLTSWQQSGDTIILTGSQTSSAADDAVFRTHMDYRIHYSDGSYEDARVLYDEPLETFRLPVKAQVKSLQMDPLSNVLKTGVVYKNTQQVPFTLKPNPFRNEIYITFRNSKYRKVSITGINGKSYLHISTSQGFVNMDLSFLEPGIYLITIEEEGKNYSEKLIKQ